MAISELNRNGGGWPAAAGGKKCLAADLNQIKCTKYIGIMELLCAGPAEIWFSAFF